jgi:hypothetical protein
MGRNAGIQSMLYAQNNGVPPFIPSAVTYTPGLLFSGYLRPSANPIPNIINAPSTWGTLANNIIPGILNTANYANNGIFISMLSTQNPPPNSAMYVTGFFRAPISGSYVFSIYKDDNVQMKLNNQLIIDIVGSNPSVSTPIVLIAGTYYPLEMLISNNAGGFRFFITQISVNSVVKFDLGNGGNVTPALNTVPSVNTLPLSSCFYN